MHVYGMRTLSGIIIGAALVLSLFASRVDAAASAPPVPGSIRVDNRMSPSHDTVVVSGLLPGDVVKVYADGGAVYPLGTASVSGGATSAPISIGQLGAAGGHIYVTVTRPSYSESRRIVKSFPAEPISDAPAATMIRAANRAGGSGDTVTVRGLHVGDIVRVYADATKSNLLGSGTVTSSTTDGTVISVSPLDAGGGVLYVTVTEQGKRESRPTEKAYEGEAETAKPQINQIRVINELGGSHDRVVVSGLQPGDVVKVYASESAVSPLAQTTVASGSTTADISVALPLPHNGKPAIYVTVTSGPLRESARVSKQYNEEPVTPAVAPGMIVVTNMEAGTQDRVEVVGLTAGDVVKVYAGPTDPQTIGTETVGTDSSRAVILVDQLGRSAGHVYVSVTSGGKGESGRTIKSYAAEQASAAPGRDDIKIVNGVGANDWITVYGVQAGDIVKVYAEEAADAPIGSATTASGAESAVVFAGLPGSGYGVVYVSVTRANEEESARTPKIYNAEPVTMPVSANSIRVINSTEANGGDEITVTGLTSGDTVKVYPDATTQTPLQTVLGADAAATVSEGASVVTIGRLQLSAEGGKVYVTVTSRERRESARTVKAYDAE